MFHIQNIRKRHQQELLLLITMADNNDDDDNDSHNVDHDDNTTIADHHPDETRTNATPDLPVATLLDNEEGEREDEELRQELRRLREQERNAI